MKKFQKIVFKALIVVSLLCHIKVQGSTKCSLTKADPEKAFPSLIKCYRNNVNACCVSAHDDYIQKMMSEMLPNACQRKFNELELFFCYGCHYDEPSSTYLNGTTKTITLCKDYAERLWGGDITQPSTQFDNCGITTYWLGDDKQEIVIPSLKWANAYQFFADVKPPFFSDYKIIISDDGSDCFDLAYIQINSFFTMLAIATAFIAQFTV